MDRPPLRAVMHKLSTDVRVRAGIALALGCGGAMLLHSGAATSGPVLCPVRLLFHIPCPSCGMTRSLAALLHGDVGYALALNPASLGVAAAALLAALALAAELVTGRALLAPLWRPRWLRVATGVAVVACMAAVWAVNLTRHVHGQGPLHTPAWHPPVRAR